MIKAHVRDFCDLPDLNEQSHAAGDSEREKRQSSHTKSRNRIKLETLKRH